MPTNIIAMCPVDTTGLPLRDRIPKPSIQHTIRACEQCSRECWIGPTQLETLKTKPKIFTALCYWCIFPRSDVSKMHVVALNDHADDIPRRT